ALDICALQGAPILAGSVRDYHALRRERRHPVPRERRDERDPLHMRRLRGAALLAAGDSAVGERPDRYGRALASLAGGGPPPRVAILHPGGRGGAARGARARAAVAPQGARL